MPNINPVTAVLLIIGLLPILNGLFMHFSRESIQRSLHSLGSSLVFILGVVGAIKITRGIFFEHAGGLAAQIYSLIPVKVQTLLYGQDILIYLVMVPFILAVLLAVIQPVAGLINRFVLYPLADGLYSLLSIGGPLLKSLVGAIAQVPRAAFSVLILSLGLNFLVYYFYVPVISAGMNDSGLYQTVNQDVLCPLLNSNLAKKIPVLVNDAFAQVTAGQDASGQLQPENLDQVAQELMKGKVIEYFNGVTLDAAVQSNSRIDGTALTIVGNETSSRKKAYLIYRWITRNIEYDYAKAEQIVNNPDGVASGSIVAFNTRKGICFDYSSLYVSMCRAAGLKVRLVTGQGYSGTNWGDHAWNQVYCPEEGRWINVDTTFGNYANYFDKSDFVADHRYGQVQGEW